MLTTPDFPQDVPRNQQPYSQTARRKDDRTVQATAQCVVIVLANHKGGVTKTTSTANLGAMLAEVGRRVCSWSTVILGESQRGLQVGALTAQENDLKTFSPARRPRTATRLPRPSATRSSTAWAGPTG